MTALCRLLRRRCRSGRGRVPVPLELVPVLARPVRLALPEQPAPQALRALSRRAPRH